MTEEMSLVVFDPIKATLVELQKKDESLVFDHTNPAGEKELRSWVRRLRGYKSDVVKAHKETKAEALAFGRKVDAVKNELTDGVQTLITERMKPLDEIEAKKRADAEAIVEAERVAKEKADSDRLADLEKREAEAAKKEAEIKAKEQEQREKEIAAEAAENAKLVAEAKAKQAVADAEQEKQEAIDKAEFEKQEAIEAEKEKARKAEADRQAEIEADKVETARLAQIEANRVANGMHRKKIEKKVQSIFLEYGVSIATATRMTADISRGIYPTLTINY